jgi:NitT/TauT family transport system permease protein
VKRRLNIVGFVIIMGAWFGVADIFKLCAPQLLPPLVLVLQRLIEIIINGSLATDMWATLFRWIVGFTSGTIGGILLGLFLGLHPRVYKMFEFPIEFIRTMPVTAIFPLFLIVFGIGDASKIAMAFTPTFLLMLVSAASGVLNASQSRIIMAKVFGATQWQIFWKIVVFETLPQIFIGLRLALSLSLIVTVVSEMFIGSSNGLGQRIYDSYLTSDSITLYAVLIVLGVLGFVLNKFVVKIEKRFVFWSGRS